MNLIKEFFGWYLEGLKYVLLHKGLIISIVAVLTIFILTVFVIAYSNMLLGAFSILPIFIWSFFICAPILTFTLKKCVEMDFGVKKNVDNNENNS